MNYVNGKWVTDQQTTLSVFDLSVIRGFGIFDFLRTYKKKPFKLQEHLDRLFNSARELEMDVPRSKEELTRIVEEGIQKGIYDDYNIRIVVTGGISEDGTTPGTASIIVMFAEAHDYPDTYYSDGISVITFSHERVFAKAKTLNYLAAIVALKHAKKRHAIEAIYTDCQNHILEGTTSNIFMVKNNVAYTPKNDILIGITRGVVCELLRKLGIQIVEKEITKDELYSADEVFVTASNKEVMPVTNVDDTQISDGSVGSITKNLVKEYRGLVRK